MAAAHSATRPREIRRLGGRVEDSILEEGVQVSNAALKRSLIGRRASVTGRGLEQVLSLNIGDDSQVVY